MVTVFPGEGITEAEAGESPEANGAVQAEVHGREQQGLITSSGDGESWYVRLSFLTSTYTPWHTHSTCSHTSTYVYTHTHKHNFAIARV